MGDAYHLSAHIFCMVVKCNLLCLYSICYVLIGEHKLVLTILHWWLVVQLIGLCALPLTTYMFRSLSQCVYPFSKTLGLLLVGYGSWLLTMIGLTPFSSGAMVLVLVLLIGSGWWLTRPDWSWSSLRNTLIQQWPRLVFYELLFIVTLIISLWLRWGAAWGPGINSTEKPMDMTFLTGILTSPTFPPQDPWLAGYSINYYYLGYIFIAVLTRLSSVSFGEAFNLGLATIFALTALMIAGVVMTMTEHTHRPHKKLADLEPSRVNRSYSTHFIAAICGVILVLGMGNQYGALEKLVGSPQIVAFDGWQLFDVLSQRIQGNDTIQIPRPFRAADLGVVSILRPQPDAMFDWWWPSRGVWDDLPGLHDEEFEASPNQFERRALPQRSYAITEMPFFSFYLGDMHPHVLVLPFALLTLVLALTVLVDDTPPASLLSRERLTTFLITSLVLGILYSINSWDAPTYALLYFGSLALRYKREIDEKRHLQPIVSNATRSAWWSYVRTLGLTVMVAGLFMCPFLLTFRSIAGSQPPLPSLAHIPLLNRLSMIIAPAIDHTNLHEFIAIFGLFFAILLAYYVTVLPQRRDDQGTNLHDHLYQFIHTWQGWGLIMVTLVIGLFINAPLLALLPFSIMLTIAAWCDARTPVRAFTYWVIAVGALVLLFTDLIYIRDFFNNRMNTIFKFYYQVWLLWGTLAGYALWVLVRAGIQRRGKLLWMLPIGILLLGASIYPWATLRETRTQALPTINALAFLETTAPDEAAAASWIRENTKPTDIVLTAVGEAYNETGRIATITGRPTLLGWNGSHEQLWRSGSPAIIDEIRNRERDIPRIYSATTSVEELRALLEQYRIKYIYVGPTERARYRDVTNFAQLPFLKQVFEQNEVQIYQRE